MSGGFLRGAHASHVLISASRRNRLLLHEPEEKSAMAKRVLYPIH